MVCQHVPTYRVLFEMCSERDGQEPSIFFPEAVVRFGMIQIIVAFTKKLEVPTGAF